MKRTRFAPSPTGYLHTGNAYSALQCAHWARDNDAALLLRIEDIDFTRCRPEFAYQIEDDLSWLGMVFDGEVHYQQKRLHLYQAALNQLIGLGVLYPCCCTRQQIQANIDVQHPSLLLDYYPHTCRNKSKFEQQHIREAPFSWRLNQQKVAEMIGDVQSWFDVSGQAHTFRVGEIGDVIIGRKDITYSYHLSVVVDDFQQGMTHIIRGEDLCSSTPVHHILQVLLGYAHPLYLHHPLIVDDAGQRLAKTKKSLTLKALRKSGMSFECFYDALMKKGL